MTAHDDTFDGVKPSVYPALLNVGGDAVPHIAIEVPITADPERGRFVTADPSTAMLTVEEAEYAVKTLLDAAANGTVTPLHLAEYGSGASLLVWPVDLSHQEELMRDLRLHVEIAKVTARCVDAHALLAGLDDPGAGEHMIAFAYEEGMRAAGVTSPPAPELVGQVRDRVLEQVAMAVAVMTFDPSGEAPQPRHDPDLLLLAAGFTAAFAYRAGLETEHTR